jgi:hypothetical protein
MGKRRPLKNKELALVALKTVYHFDTETQIAPKRNFTNVRTSLIRFDKKKIGMKFDKNNNEI